MSPLRARCGCCRPIGRASVGTMTSTPPARIFLAGASGVIGRAIIPLLVAQGATVGGLTRSADRAPALVALGAEPIVGGVYDRDALIAAVRSFAPDVVMHQLTDLPDDAAELPDAMLRNARIRTEGTRNLVAAATAADARRFLAQSIAWPLAPGPGADAVAELERTVLGMDGTVLRYGQFYGPGTYFPGEPPNEPRVHVDTAAARTVEALSAAPGVIVVVD